MGAFDGAETTDIVGLYLLSQLQEIFENSHFQISHNLYRDDGLSWTNATARTTEKIKQKIADVFKKHGLSVSIVANSKQVDFLDVTLNLDTGTYKPFIKPGDKPLYVNSESNHPPCVIKNIPKGINQRLSAISSSKEVFDQAAPLYQSELDRNGYKHKLQYEPPIEKRSKRNRRKKVIYFNPPYSMNVSTKVGKLFLKLLDESFPPGHPLHPLLNWNTVKLRYSCLPNIGSQVAKHNAKILKTIEPPEVTMTVLKQ